MEIISNQGELTGNTNPSTLEVRGNIFMAEPGSPHREPPKINQGLPIDRDITQKPTPDKIQGKWEEELGMPFEKMPDDMRQVVGLLKKDGILPGSIAGGAPDIDMTGINDLEIRNFGNQYNRHLTNAGETSEVLRDLWKDLVNKSVRPEQEAERNLLLQRMDESIARARQQEKKEAEDRAAAQESKREERFGFYLQSEDLDILRVNPVKWLDSQFDTLYNLAQEGQELSSPVINNMQTVVSEAIRYIQYNRPEELDQFQRLFTIRFNLIQMRTTIGYKSIQNIQETAYKLQVHGLMYGLSLEEGRVGKMFNRLHEMLEDRRLNSEKFHVTPELINRLQDDLIKEQADLSEIGGIFAVKAIEGETEPDRKKRIEADVRRAVRTAFDILVSSQRMAVIVARGKHLTENDAYFSDPASGPLNVYNLEELLTEKFGIFNVQEQELLRQMKLDMADNHLKKNKLGVHSMSEEEREDLGKRLFRDLFAVPDFFTSGWRIKGVVDALEERLGKEKAKEFALFMRLRNSKNKLEDEDKKKLPEDQPELKRDVWNKIAKYRPEEIMRLFRERDQGRLVNLDKEILEIDDLLQSEEGETVYDKFKHKYGKALNTLREQGFEKDAPEQTDMANLTAGQKELVRKLLIGDPEAGDKVVKIFTKMQERIGKENMIDDLMTDSKFEDIYTRTLVLDDALLNKLELDTWNGEAVTPLSKRYGADQGGDALVRVWNDTANAIKAGQSLIGFIKTENGEKRGEQALAFADAAAQYNGEQNRAKIVRFTMGTFLNLSKQDFMWDALGVGKLPFRRAMSKIEEIYGPQAHPMSRDELRAQLDNLHSVLVYHSNDEKGMKTATEFYRDLEVLLEVTAMDATKRRAVSLLFYLILAAMLEGYELSGIKQASGGK